MQYKTIVMGLLEAQPAKRTGEEMILDLNRYSHLLKDSHEMWKATLIEKRPGSNSDQITSEALELAVADIQDCIASESQADDSTFSLDAAMQYVRKHPQDQ